VAQRGSLVAPDRQRFDFVHPKPISPQELAEVEDIANTIVLQNAPVETRLMGVEDAKQSGARALFGEKYGDEVRVVSMGDPTGNTLGWSVELCGGTHVRRTGAIGLITVLGDSGVAAGVRRIEALQDNLKKSERALSEAQKKLALGGSSGAAAPAAETINGTAFVGRIVEGVAAKDLRGLVDTEKKKLGSGVVALVLKGEDGKGTIAIGVTDNLVAKFSAAELIKHATVALGGQGGGGRPDMAQGGGPDGAKAADAVAAVRSAL
jgi:alanyl-tRNA synthetase